MWLDFGNAQLVDDANTIRIYSKVNWEFGTDYKLTMTHLNLVKLASNMIHNIQHFRPNGTIIIFMKCAIAVQLRNSAWKRKLNRFFPSIFLRCFCFPMFYFRDILTLRDTIRKKFLIYYAEENLYDSKAHQMAENRIMDSVEEFDQVWRCLKPLKHIKMVKVFFVIRISTSELLQIIWRLGPGSIRQNYRKK